MVQVHHHLYIIVDVEFIDLLSTQATELLLVIYYLLVGT